MHRKPATSSFDQDHSKNKKQNTRSKTHPQNANTLAPPSPSGTSAIAPSSDTKKQPSNFRFSKPNTPQTTPGEPIADTSPGDDSAPQSIPNDAPEPVPPTPVKSSTTGGGTAPGSLVVESFKDAPQTPAPRISLAQLVDYEDPQLLPAPTQGEMSPEDRILWQSGTPRPRLGAEFGLKRVAEDSPSQFNTPANKKRKDGNLDMDLKGSKTPLDDPASQLWKRYSGSGARSRISDPTARLFQGANRSPSTFRRSLTSPGALNLSRLKRRKTTAFDELKEDSDPAAELPEAKASTVPRAAGRKQRVSLLLDEIKRNMDSPDPDIPPSSSPLRAGDESALPSSPVRARPAPGRTMSNDIVTTEPSTALDSDGDDYGDFEVDLDDLAEIDQIASTAIQAATASSAATPPPPVAQKTFDGFDDDDDYGDDDLFGGGEIESLMASYDTPQVPAANTADRSNETARRIQRFEVVDISKGDYQKNGKTCTQTILLLRDDTSPISMKAFLRDIWQQATILAVGQTVNVIGSFDKSGVCIIDNSHNYLVVEPDYLMSATVVADTVGCMRKAVLQERVKATGDISKAMVYGNILHALFQVGLENNNFSAEGLKQHIDRILLNNMTSLYQLRDEIPDLSVASDYVLSKLHFLQEWAQKYIMVAPNANSTVTDHRGKLQPLVAINKLLDIEEHIWSPRYGLKGNIDATVQAVIVEGPSKKTLTVPLELKTGRNSSVITHRAQTMLYTLLMSDRYDISVGAGLLYYMEQNEMIRVPAIRNELRELIIKRNEVASYAINRGTLPEMLQDERTCSRCYAKTSCLLYHKLMESGTEETSGIPKDFAELTQHLTPRHAEFFSHWDSLLTLEDKGSIQFRREVWTMNSAAREALGRSFGDVIMVPGSITVDPNNAKINRYGYSFQRIPGDDKTFYDSQLGEGDPIVISDEKGHYALAIGFITHIRRHQITVQVDRRLHNARSRQKGFEENTKQVFNGIFDISTSSQGTRDNVHDQVVYRVDKDEYGSGMANIRNNLVQLFAKGSNPKYRRLIVDLEEPNFKAIPAALSSKSQANLNGDQRKAVEKVLSARDYALVLGMPGTGKTTTIAHIIRMLVGQGKSILLTSYTHTAVDNILMKISNDKFDILRLGSRAKIHPDIAKFSRLAEDPRNSFEELKNLFETPQIVATTCLGINHPIFTERVFDYCIVDEASQITLPVCIGPIRFANTFVLVGDHFQLPPLVRNTAAREGGLDVSLFKMLCEAHPSAVVNLEHQYRMCEEIMTLSNELIYSGRLKCGTAEVANRSLRLPHDAGLARLHDQDSNCSAPCWIEDLLAENVKACFVDTDSVPAREERKGDRINNPIEADMVHQLVEALLSCGVDPTAIGVISVYRSQLKTIQHLLRYRPAVEMYTADRFQGRDKEIVIISLVRSNTQSNVGELLRDWRRINVAFTRARSKLIILGSGSTLNANDLLRDFVKLMQKNKWVYNLPENAHLMHQFPEMSSALPTTPKKRNAAGRETTPESPKSPKSPKRSPRRSPRRSPKRIDGRMMAAKKEGAVGRRGILGNIVNDML